MAWMAQAACKGKTDIFFPLIESGGRYHPLLLEALRICATCDVTRQCWNTAVYYKATDGVWGGHYIGSQRSAHNRV